MIKQSMSETNESIQKIKLQFCDEVHLKFGNQKVILQKTIVCSKVKNLLQQLLDQYGEDLSKWPIPNGTDHSHLWIKKVILSAQGQWKLPYQQTEICHCRAVSTETVEDAVMLGAHDMKTISRWTSASTSCGTCQPDVESVLKYILETPTKD